MTDRRNFLKGMAAAPTVFAKPQTLGSPDIIRLKAEGDDAMDFDFEKQNITVHGTPDFRYIWEPLNNVLDHSLALPAPIRRLGANLYQPPTLFQISDGWTIDFPSRVRSVWFYGRTHLFQIIHGDVKPKVYMAGQRVGPDTIVAGNYQHPTLYPGELEHQMMIHAELFTLEERPVEMIGVGPRTCMSFPVTPMHGDVTAVALVVA